MQDPSTRGVSDLVRIPPQSPPIPTSFRGVSGIFLENFRISNLLLGASSKTRSTMAENSLELQLVVDFQVE